MSYLASPEFTDASNPMDRIDSGDTADSPFGSNLVTPTDEEMYQNPGIHERFDLARTIRGYFASRTGSRDSMEAYDEPLSKVIQSKISVGAFMDTTKGLKEPELDAQVDIEPDINVPNTFDSMESLPSPLSSLSSSDSFLRTSAASIYNLPNDHILVDTPPKYLDAQAEEGEDALELNDSEPTSLPNKTDLAFNPMTELTVALSESFLDLFILGFKISFFLPWCVAVGGALIFFPDHLDWLAFGTGYIETLSGIRRYSHWAAYGFQHVVAFFTFLGAVLWQYPNFGCVVIGILLGHFCLAWHNFLFDPTVPLGEDARHTTYLLATTTWFNHDNSINVKEVDDNYYWTKKFSAEEIDVDSD